MRCQEARQWLEDQREDSLAPADASALQEHLRECADCRAFQQYQRHLETVLRAPAPRIQSRITTDHIMQAIQQQKRITQQLEDIRKRQQSRVERLRSVGAAMAAISFFTLSSIPLLLLAITIIQTDLVLKALTLLNGVIDTLIILSQYLQTGLTVVTRNNWLLSGVAFACVIMMGMWLRLMRQPQEV
jgi:predicted anti-sigma-YlaC factor YlaD